MKILFPVRVGAGSKFDGEFRLVDSYARELRAAGCDVVVSNRLHEQYATFDVVHFVSIHNSFETYIRLRRIRAGRRQPVVVLTPLHHKTEWLLPYYRHCLGIDLGQPANQGSLRFNGLITMKDVLRFGIAAMGSPTLLFRTPYLVASTFRQKRYIAEKVDALLVHSEEETGSIRADLQSAAPRSFNVSVGWTPPDRRARKPDFPRDYLLSVGRIEPLKNQLNLMEAMRSLDLPLILVGRENQRHRGYLRRFRAALSSRGDVFYFPHLDQETLEALYQNARLHVIASWFEVFPLTTVEAAANNCRVLTTRYSYESGIYGPQVGYLSPETPVAIRNGIEQTLTHKSLGSANAVIATIPRWREAAERLLGVYRRLLTERR